jgi:glycosyltransferase involved in cell wall biosynthesis
MVVEAVESVLQQSCNSLEIIVVDDGSTDATAKSLSTIFPEILVLQQANAERGAARNRGARAARGRYLCFLDSDDLFEPWHVAQLSAFLELNDPSGASSAYAPVVSAPAVIWNPESGQCRSLKAALALRRRPLAEACLLGTVLPVQGLFVSPAAMSAVGGFPEDRAVARSEDWVFLARLAARFPIARLMKSSVRLRDHPGRSVLDPVRTEASSLAAMRLLLEEGVSHQPLDMRSRGLVTAGAHMLCAANYYGAGRMRAAREHLAQAAGALPLREAVPLLWRRWVQTWLSPRAARRLRELKGFLVAQTDIHDP